MTAKTNSGKSNTPKRPPARSLANRENQLIDLAVNLAEKQLEDGTASAQVLSHYLKLATVREQLEREKLISEIEWNQMKVEAQASQKRMETVFEEALDAMKRYSGTV